MIRRSVVVVPLFAVAWVVTCTMKVLCHRQELTVGMRKRKQTKATVVLLGGEEVCGLHYILVVVLGRAVCAASWWRMRQQVLQ